MSYDFSQEVPRSTEQRAAAHTQLAEEMASWPYVPPEARFLLRMMEHFGGALDVLQAPSHAHSPNAHQQEYPAIR